MKIACYKISIFQRSKGEGVNVAEGVGPSAKSVLNDNIITHSYYNRAHHFTSDTNV